jgi:hypothetical protein
MFKLLPKKYWAMIGGFLLFFIVLLIDESRPTGEVVNGSVVSLGASMGSRSAEPNENATIELENGITLYLSNRGYKTGQKLVFRQYKSKILGKVTYRPTAS